VLKIKRGFRVLFNNSVYGLFQAERMQEARRRLANGNTSVMTVAADQAMPTPAISPPHFRSSLASPRRPSNV
jgi:AraC family transcriptional regulator